jgi:hypothetical protein
MHKNATKCNETLNKWCKNKHGASKIIDTFETYHRLRVVGGGNEGAERPAIPFFLCEGVGQASYKGRTRRIQSDVELFRWIFRRRPHRQNCLDSIFGPNIQTEYLDHPNTQNLRIRASIHPNTQCLA